MAFATIDVTKGITGTIPVANGGTGIASGTTGQFLKFTGTTTIASAADNAGKVLQVVSSTSSTETSTNSTSFSDTGLNVDITPSSSSSKILIIVNHTGLLKEASDNAGQIELGRTISGGSFSSIRTFETNFGRNNSTALNVVGGTGTSCLDSPSTTSAINYKTRFRCDMSASNTVRVQQNNCTASITAMEIST